MSKPLESTLYTLQFLRNRLDKILKVIIARSNPGDIMMLFTYIPQLMYLPYINFLHLTFPKYSPAKIVMIKVTTARSNATSSSHMLHTYTHPHLHPPSMNCLYLTVSEMQPRQEFYCCQENCPAT